MTKKTSTMASEPSVFTTSSIENFDEGCGVVGNDVADAFGKRRGLPRSWNFTVSALTVRLPPAARRTPMPVDGTAVGNGRWSDNSSAPSFRHEAQSLEQDKPRHRSAARMNDPLESRCCQQRLAR